MIEVPAHHVAVAEVREGPRMHEPRAGSVWPCVRLSCDCGWTLTCLRTLAGAHVRAHHAGVAEATA